MSSRPLADRLIGVVLALSALPLVGTAAETLADGVTVRVRSAAIEAGWHTGRITRDDRSCSIVQLDRPTERGRTQIALLAVDALQLGRIGAWTAISARSAIAAEPAHCLADNA